VVPHDIVNDVLSSPGAALNPALQKEMEQRFSHDFSHVRVHFNSAADRSTRALDAQAYTVGRNIAFAAGRLAPETHQGRHLIAHELTHIVQQESVLNAPPTIMRAGRTFGGFLANIFQFWDYSKATLDTYLKVIDQQNQIQRDDDSDDMARQIVAEWKQDKSKYDLKPKIKVLLVREMLDGIVSGADQERISDLLEGSTNSDLQAMFKPGPNGLTYPELYTRFDSFRSRLEFFNQRVLSNLGRITEPDPKDAKSIEKRLGEVEAEHGIELKDLSISFHLAPGTYYNSFLVNLTAPDYGVYVTITLTQSSLQVTLEPSLLIDLAWPLSNAQLRGFTLTFAGLKPKLDIQGIELVSGIAQGKVVEYVKGLLAGTRFENPAYDPMKDPDLISELTHPQIIGDIDRVKYNFEKGPAKSEDGPDIAKNVPDVSFSLGLVHKKGLPIPSQEFGLVIPPGTGFVLWIGTSGNASELMKKNVRLEKVRIRSSGIFVYKGNVKIAGLEDIEMGRDAKIAFGPVKTFVDLKEIAKQEAPDWAKGIVDKATSAMKSYDEFVDLINALSSLATGTRPERSDIAKDIAVWVGEEELRAFVIHMLSENREDIKRLAGITDAQLNEFFGIQSGDEKERTKSLERR
jgi:hypothetical protein